MLQFRDELAQRLSLPSGKSFPDPNNNNKNNGTTGLLKTMGTGTIVRGDKYLLRPRSSIRSKLSACDDHETSNDLQNSILNQHDSINPANSHNINTSSSVAALTTKIRQTKPKQKPAPLSKYRRKTANARERSRMREINSAFEALRRAVPHIFVSQCTPVTNSNGMNQTNSQSSEKLTKITTLRLAMRYISALSAVLNNQQNTSPIDLESTSPHQMTTPSSLFNSSSKLDHQSKLDLIDSPQSSSRLSVCSSISSNCSSTAASNNVNNLNLKNEFKLDLDTLLMESSDAESLCTLSDNSFPLSSDQPLTPLTFDDNPLTDSTSVYFGDQTLSLDFTDNSLSSPDFSESSPFDQFLPHFS